MIIYYPGFTFPTPADGERWGREGYKEGLGWGEERELQRDNPTSHMQRQLTPSTDRQTGRPAGPAPFDRWRKRGSEEGQQWLAPGSRSWRVGEGDPTQAF